MFENWQEMDAKSRKDFDNQMNEAKKSSDADRVFYSAAQCARYSVENDGLMPLRGEFGELIYSPEQGAKAACLAREDVATTVQVQLAIIKRLDRNRNYMAVAIALLLYIIGHLN